MIKQGIISEELNVDSHARKRNGSCPLMPEEVLFEFSLNLHQKFIHLAQSTVFISSFIQYITF